MPSTDITNEKVKKELEGQIKDLNDKMLSLNNEFDNAISSIELGVAISTICKGYKL